MTPWAHGRFTYRHAQRSEVYLCNYENKVVYIQATETQLPLKAEFKTHLEAEISLTIVGVPFIHVHWLGAYSTRVPLSRSV